jgi:hypothetical protein
MDELYGVKAKHSRAQLEAPETDQACPFFLTGIMKSAGREASHTWHLTE